MSYFDVYGPFDLNISENRKISSQTDLVVGWRQIVSESGGVAISQAIGCYVFCIRYRNKLRPWYVGMTVAEKGFEGEVFQKHKVDIYNNCLSRQKGWPVIFLMPLVLEHVYKFSKNKSEHKRAIQWLETTLMGFAYRQNPEISNIRDMKFLKNVQVNGLLGRRPPGRPFTETKAIRQALLGMRTGP